MVKSNETRNEIGKEELNMGVERFFAQQSSNNM
jgi:hypothetical protein